MSLIKCPECGAMLSDKAVACPACGAPNMSLHVPRCLDCNSPVSLTDKYCPNCGARQNRETDVAGEAEPKSRKLYLYMLITAVVLILVIIASVLINKIDRPVDAAIASRDSSIAAEEEAKIQMVKTAQERKNERLYLEKANPRKYLKHEYSSRNNLLGETIISGSLSSSATLVSYAGSRLQVTFFNRKGAELGKGEIILSDTIAPGQILEYREKIAGPKGSREAEVVLLSAKSDR